MTLDDLKNVRRQRLRVISLQERIDRLRSRAEYTAQQLGERGQDDATRDRLAEYIAELDDLEHHLTKEVIDLEHAMLTVDEALAELPEAQEAILRLRYCEGLSWKLVAVEAKYCADYCRQLDGKFRKDLTQTHI